MVEVKSLPHVVTGHLKTRKQGDVCETLFLYNTTSAGRQQHVGFGLFVLFSVDEYCLFAVFVHSCTIVFLIVLYLPFAGQQVSLST